MRTSSIATPTPSHTQSQQPPNSHEAKKGRLTEKIKTLSPRGKILLSSLSTRIILEDEETRCSPRV